MHVCFLCNEYPPDPHGGIGSVTQTLARALAARAHRVTVVGYTRHASGESDDERVRVVRLPHAPLRGTGIVVNRLRLRRALADIARSAPIDVIEGPENSLCGVPSDAAPVRVIRMHGGHHYFSVTLGGETRLQRGWMERRSFARATHLCAVSGYVGKTTLELLGQTERRVEVLPNPVDTSMFRPPTTAAEQAGTIVFAGTLCEKKGLRQLLQAMQKVRRAAPDARLIVAGRDTRDPATGRWYGETLRASLDPEVAARVCFTGPVEHGSMPALLATATVCVYPSHMEALPVAWLEAMAMGKAVVASRLGPGPEVVEHGVSGLLCNPRDPAEIAACIVQLLHSEALRRRLGRAARQRVLTHFAPEALIPRNEAFYERCRLGV